MDTFSSESKGSSLTMKSKMPVSLKISLLIHFGYQYFMVLAESSTDLNYYLFTMPFTCTSIVLWYLPTQFNTAVSNLLFIKL